MATRRIGRGAFMALLSYLFTFALVLPAGDPVGSAFGYHLAFNAVASLVVPFVTSLG